MNRAPLKLSLERQFLPPGRYLLPFERTFCRWAPRFLMAALLWLGWVGLQAYPVILNMNLR